MFLCIIWLFKKRKKYVTVSIDISLPFQLCGIVQEKMARVNSVIAKGYVCCFFLAKGN